MIRFVARNPEYALRNWRKLPKVRRAMRLHKAQHPTCRWCGTIRKCETHHITPVAIEPEWAAYLSNMVTLCRGCHLSVGHNGNWKRYVDNVVSLCEIAQRAMIVHEN